MQQVLFAISLLAGGLLAALFGYLVGLPSLRLKGDYLAIVTLGFGEIVQDGLKNLPAITKGTEGINPLPAPTVLDASLKAVEVSGETPFRWFFVYLALLAVVVFLCRNLEFSRLGRQWFAVREDELAARCMAIADIFEALTAGDRPYKKAKTLTEALAILGNMKLSGHIDPDIFDVFMWERVYERYARAFLPPEQLDAVDPARIPGYARPPLAA